MYQHLNREKWLTHVKRLEALGERILPIECPRPESCCPQTFDSVLELHIHGIDMEREPKPRKRPREGSDGIRQGQTKKRRRTNKQDGTKEHCFVNTTIESMSARSPNICASPSGRSTPVGSVSSRGRVPAPTLHRHPCPAKYQLIRQFSLRQRL